MLITHGCPEVVGDFQIPPEPPPEVRVALQYFQYIVPAYLVQVAVRQRSHGGLGLSHGDFQRHRLPKRVSSPYKKILYQKKLKSQSFRTF